LAVAAELTRLDAEAKIVFVCSNRAIDRKILDPLPYGIVPQTVRPIPRSLGAIWPFVRDYVRSARLARDLVADLKPKAVVGLGGFAAVPVVGQAAKVGIPTALLNPDAVSGKANQWLAKRAGVIFTQFESTAAAFAENIRAKVRCVGCPIRPEFAPAGVRRDAGADAAEGKLFFQLDPAKKTLLVFGGSLLAEPISDAVEALAEDLRPLASAWQVLHVSSSPRAGDVERRLVSAGLAVKTLAYCHRMDLAYAAADMVLARAGAGTVAELSATGTPSVLLPYPHHKDQHQKLNAAQLESAGAAVICTDLKNAQANALCLREKLLPILANSVALETMRIKARGLGKTGAAVEVAKWMILDR
jgi:UDP-N-acetylglucosamine--N-acetylmuramyl-(pentapeptide) pyrophosphoryl-undecaprenol N-acetylglucosamine transferase